MPFSPATKRARFSFGLCVAVAFLHLAITFIIGVYYVLFLGHHFWKGILWIWTPLANAVLVLNLGTDKMLIGLAILWSCVVGIAAGFGFPALCRRKSSNGIVARPNQDATGNAR